MTAARVAKLEALLARVQRHGAAPRPMALVSTKAPAAAPSKPLTHPPPRVSTRPAHLSEPPEDVSDAVEYVDDDVEEVVEPTAAAAVAPAPTEDDMVVEVSSEEVDLEGGDSEPELAPIAAKSDRASGPVPSALATSETHMRAASVAPPAPVLEVADDSVPDVEVSAESEVDYEAPRHTPPPESGSQRAAQAEEAPDPSGEWSDVPAHSSEETGVRSSKRGPARPSAPPASERKVSVAPASGRHASVPAPTAPAARAPSTPPAPTTTLVSLSGTVAASSGNMRIYEPPTFDDMLDESLDL